MLGFGVRLALYYIRNGYFERIYFLVHQPLEFYYLIFNIFKKQNIIKLYYIFKIKVKKMNKK